MSLQVVLSDHVVLRGRYTMLQLTLLGYPDHDGAEATAERAKQPAVDDYGPPLPDLMPGVQIKDAQLQDLEAAANNILSSPAPIMPGGAPLPMATMPPMYVHAITNALDYFMEVCQAFRCQHVSLFVVPVVCPSACLRSDTGVWQYVPCGA